MRYRLQYIPGKKCYSVRRNLSKKGRKRTKKNKIFSKCTTREKAKRQIRLLNALKYNKTFKKYKPVNF